MYSRGHVTASMIAKLYSLHIASGITYLYFFRSFTFFSCRRPCTSIIIAFGRCLMDARACRSTLMNSVFSSLLGLQIRSWALIKRLGINYIENYEGIKEQKLQFVLQIPFKVKKRRALWILKTWWSMNINFQRAIIYRKVFWWQNARIIRCFYHQTTYPSAYIQVAGCSVIRSL